MPWLDDDGCCSECGEYTCLCEEGDQEELSRALMACRCFAQNNALIGPHEG